MNQDTTQSSLPKEVEQFLVRQEIGYSIGRFVALVNGRGMSTGRVWWPSNLYPNRAQHRNSLRMLRTAGTLGRKTKKSYRKTVARAKAKAARKARKR